MLSPGLVFENCAHSRDPIIGCALEGIADIVAGIKDVSIVLHSPQGCSSTVAAAYDTHEIDFTRRKVACTRLFETDIILGAAEKLKELIKETDRVFRTGVMFVIGTCAADIIGEDIAGLCRKLQPEVNARLIPFLAGGFRGNSYDGANMGLDGLLPLIQATEKKIPRSVNLIAPQANINPTWWADLKWVTGILQALDITIQTVLLHQTPFEALEQAGQASANLLLSHDIGAGFAQKMAASHDIPLILGDLPLPIGVHNTTRWLTALGEHFHVERQAAALITQGEAQVVDTLRRRALMIIPRYRNCRVAVSADATFGIGLLSMLFEELEMIPEALLVRSGSPNARRLLEQELHSLGISPKVAYAVDGYQIRHTLAQVAPDAVIGSAWERYMAEEIGIKVAFDLFAPSNREVYLDRTYFGYEGMLNLLETMANDWERAFRSKEIHFPDA